MEYRRLGNSGLRVSLIGLGCNNFGEKCDLEATRRIFEKACDIGINFFDTADIYGEKGGSETLMGEVMGAQRNDIILATKCGLPMDDSSFKQGASRRWIMRAVEDSLSRLKTDRIDLYQIHMPDPLTPMGETMRALDDLVRQGKVRYLGLSNHAAWQVVDAQWIARSQGLNAIVSCQNHYSLLARDPDRDLIPAMRSFGIGLLPYFPLASGLLTGKYERGKPRPEGARLAGEPRPIFAQFLTERNFELVDKLSDFARARGHTILELAMSWLARRPTVTSIIAGATSPEQVVQNAEAVDWDLSEDDMAEIDRLLAPAA